MEKMTNVKALEFVLSNCELTAEVREKVERIKASYAKKSATTGERKPTATQVANKALQESIYAEMEDGVAYRVGDMVKNLACVVGLSSSKVTAMLTQMKDAGLVARSEEKGKVYYTKIAVGG